MDIFDDIKGARIVYLDNKYNWVRCTRTVRRVRQSKSSIPTLFGEQSTVWAGVVTIDGFDRVVAGFSIIDDTPPHEWMVGDVL